MKKAKSSTRAAKKSAVKLREELLECCENILTLAEMLEICGTQIKADWLGGKAAIRFGRMIYRETSRMQELLNDGVKIRK